MAGSYGIEHPLMDPTEPDMRPEESVEPRALLVTYLDSGRRDFEFVALVDGLAGLVFSSALRRTGNRALAEEVAQNVFAVLARKAGSLRSHPNLSAWVFRTTQLESIKAMRTEQRHSKKIAAFSREDVHPRDAGDRIHESTWQEVLPALDTALDELPEKDRSLLIARFFEKKRFAEISRSSGKSEAACKMQLKRSLEKLATMLRSRGVALSVPALAAGLSMEFAKASAMASPILAAKALAASGSISAANLFSNTLLTMSTAKSSAIAAALVMVTLIPVAHLESQAASLRSEIGQLETEASSSAAGRSPDRSRTVPVARPVAMTMSKLLGRNRGVIEAGALLDDMALVMREQDIAGLIRVLTPVANMDAADFSGLMEDMEAMKGSAETKAMAMQVLASLAPESDHRETVENLIRQGVNPSGWGDAVRRWAGADPDAALAWFEEMRAEGKLLGKGVHGDPTLFVLADIAAGMAGSRPDQALEIAAGMTSQERRQSRIADKLVPILAATYLESGDRGPLDRLVGTEDAGHRKDMLVDDIGKALAGTGDFNAARTFIANTVADSGSVDERMVTVLANLRDLPFKERAEWIIGNTRPADTARHIGGLVESSVVLGEDATAWIREQPASDMKNQALSSLSAKVAIRQGLTAGLAIADEISDPAMREAARKRAGTLVESLLPDNR